MLTCTVDAPCNLKNTLYRRRPVVPRMRTRSPPVPPPNPPPTSPPNIPPQMFQPLGSNSITVCFNTEDLAEEAREKWKGDVGAGCNVVALGKGESIPFSQGGKKKKKKGAKRGGGGFMKAMKEVSSEETGGDKVVGVLPPSTECAIFVAPTKKELVKIKAVDEEVGQGTLVILLNPRAQEWEVSRDAMSQGAK